MSIEIETPTIEGLVGYLRTIRTGADRAVRENGEVVGYWQTTEWIEALMGYIAPVIQRLDSTKEQDLTTLFEANPLTLSIAKMLILMHELNSQTTVVKLDTRNDIPQACAIFLRGEKECQELLSALKQLEAKWEQEGDGETPTNLTTTC